MPVQELGKNGLNPLRTVELNAWERPQCSFLVQTTMENHDASQTAANVGVSLLLLYMANVTK